MIQSQVTALTAEALVDYDSSSAVALVHSALAFGIDETDTDESFVPLFAKIHELKRTENDSATNGNGTRVVIPLDLAKQVCSFAKV